VRPLGSAAHPKTDSDQSPMTLPILNPYYSLALAGARAQRPSWRVSGTTVGLAGRWRGDREKGSGGGIGRII
jgi:hypothetical protein